MGAPEGYEKLLSEQTPALFRRALLLCHDWHHAEDLVQEVAVTVLMKWRHVSKAENRAAYVHTLMTNTFLNKTRKRSYGETPSEIKVPDHIDPWPGIDLEIRVAESLATLKPDERAVIIGRYVDDLPVADVAASMGRKESWVRVTAHRALEKLRIDLDADGEPISPSSYQPRRGLQTTTTERGSQE